jgi:hypothetical protein
MSQTNGKCRRKRFQSYRPIENVVVLSPGENPRAECRVGLARVGDRLLLTDHVAKNASAIARFFFKAAPVDEGKQRDSQNNEEDDDVIQ